MKNYLYDDDFLARLESMPNHNRYIKIIALTLDEKPIEEIVGTATGGTITIDGSSAVRRTCQLSLISENTEITNFYWGLTNKFSLQIGLQNDIENKYPEVIWFNQGVFAITSFSVSENANSISISISGKDKMCFLNGDLGGVFPHQTDLKHIQEKSKDESGHDIIFEKDLTIPEIIREMIHQYGGEPFHNIIINDLPIYGFEQLDLCGDEDIYQIIYEGDGGSSSQFPNYVGQSVVDFEGTSITSNGTTIKEFMAQEKELSNVCPKNSNEEFTIRKYSFGDAVGYRITDLTFPGELIAQAGGTVVSILDQLKKVLNNFEYFYDEYGHFVFQRQKTYLDTAWTLQTDGGELPLIRNIVDSNQLAFSFADNTLISSISNSPDLNTVKNDYCVWGQKKSIEGADIKIHARYAIHNKPTHYTSITVSEDEINEAIKMSFPSISNENLNKLIEKYKQESNITYNQIIEGKTLTENIYYDWREILYRMSIDYLRYNHIDNFENKVFQANPQFAEGKTGYEQYYTDMLEFWRQLYCDPFDPPTFSAAEQKQLIFFQEDIPKKKEQMEEQIKDKSEREKRIHGYQNGIVSTEVKYDTGTITVEEKDKKIKEYQSNIDTENNAIKEIESSLNYLTEYISQSSQKLQSLEEKQSVYYQYQMNETNYKRKFWNKDVFDAPENLLFWIDFLDPGQSNTSTETFNISQFSISAIGTRPKTSNNTQAKAISYREVPNIIYCTPDEMKNVSKIDFLQSSGTGYSIAQVPESYMKQAFKTSTKRKTIMEDISEQLYSFAFGSNQAQLSVIPIFHLQPNTKILIKNKELNLNDEYIVKRMSLPLNYNSMMSISATKIAKRFY